MKLLLIAYIFALLCASCGSYRGVTEVPVKQTLIETVELHDTTVQCQLVPYYTERETAADSSRLTNEYAYSYAYWDGNILHHNLGIFPGAFVTFRVPDYKTYTHYTTKEVPVAVEVEKKLTLWQKVKLKVGGYSITLSLMLLLSFAIYYLVRFRNSAKS